MCGNENGANYLEADYEKIGRKLCEGMAIQLHDEVEIKQGLLDKAIEKMTKIK